MRQKFDCRIPIHTMGPKLAMWLDDIAVTRPFNVGESEVERFVFGSIAYNHFMSLMSTHKGQKLLSHRLERLSGGCFRLDGIEVQTPLQEQCSEVSVHDIEYRILGATDDRLWAG